MKTLVVGASENPNRYSYRAIKSLVNHGHEVVGISNRPGKVDEVVFLTEHAPLSDVHTVTLYINPSIQEEYEDYLISLKPKRVIFNPGSENNSFIEKLQLNDIEPVIACTLVMLNTNQYEK